VRQSLLKLWCWLVRAYAITCIAVVIAVYAFHTAFPDYGGIPRWLFVLVHLPILGLGLLPVIFLIEVVLVKKRIYRSRTFVWQAVLVTIAWGFCLQVLRQSPPPPPNFGVTVVGNACLAPSRFVPARQS
jgi:hypothetical protein